MTRIVIRYSLLLFAALALFKGFEYAFFSHIITLDLYLGLTALVFLIIGAFAIRYLWPKVEIRQPPQPQADPEVLARFSKRERQLLVLVAQGYTNKEIAQLIHLSPNTVKTHLKSLFVKLDVTNRTQASAQAKILNIL